MNERLYDAAQTLDDAKLRADQGAFFKSILGTLNHVLVGDIIWLKRFAEHPKKYSSLAGLRQQTNPASLDAILHENIGSLRAARHDFDDVITSWSEEVEEDDLAIGLVYTNTKGREFVDNFGQLVQHFYNHQTHHRGQVTTLLNQNGVDVGTTDLLAIIRG